MNLHRAQVSLAQLSPRMTFSALLLLSFSAVSDRQSRSDDLTNVISFALIPATKITLIEVDKRVIKALVDTVLTEAQRQGYNQSSEIPWSKGSVSAWGPFYLQGKPFRRWRRLTWETFVN